jgi:hypothetical protein
MSEHKVRALEVVEQAIREAQQLVEDPDKTGVLQESYTTTALVYIAVELADIDPHLALQVAEQVEGDLLVQISGQVAALMHQCTIASSALMFRGGLEDVLKRLASVHLDRAFETAEQMAEPLRGEMLGHLAQAVAGTDPERAFLLAEQDILPRHFLLGFIVIELAKADLDRALRHWFRLMLAQHVCWM